MCLTSLRDSVSTYQRARPLRHHSLAHSRSERLSRLSSVVTVALLSLPGLDRDWTVDSVAPAHAAAPKLLLSKARALAFLAGQMHG